MEIQKKAHILEVDRMRGIAIILVVLGHSSPQPQIEMNPIWFQMLYKFIYLFHMPLFFLISGFCFYTVYANCETWRDKGSALLRKVRRLVIPYFFYSFVTLILKTVFAQYAIRPFQIEEAYKILFGENPNGGLWFLWILFMMLVISLVVNKLPLSILLVITFVLKLGTGIWSIQNNLLRQLATFSIFFVAGLLLRKNYNWIRNMKLDKVFIAIIFYFVAGGIAMWQLKPMIIVVLGGMLAIVATWMVAICIKDNSKMDVILKMLSEYSMDIYLLSYFVQVPIRVIKLNFVPIPYGVTFLLMFLLGGVIPMVLSKYVIKKNKLLSLLLLGRECK